MWTYFHDLEKDQSAVSSWVLSRRWFCWEWNRVITYCAGVKLWWSEFQYLVCTVSELKNKSLGNLFIRSVGMHCYKEFTCVCLEILTGNMVFKSRHWGQTLHYIKYVLMKTWNSVMVSRKLSLKKTEELEPLLSISTFKQSWPLLQTWKSYHHCTD